VAAQPVLFVASLAPALSLGYLTWTAYHGEPSAWPAVTGNFSANPLEDITHETGLWALRFLCLTLVATPLRRLTGWNAAIRFRRMLGLFAFFYAVLHVLTYAILDRFMSLAVPDMMSWASWRALASSILDDIVKRPYITVGFLAFVAMVPLAVTSTAGMIRRLGGRRWQQLHRLIYLSAIGGVVHYWWLVKADIRHPLAYAVVVGVLLVFRVYWARRRRTPAAARGVAPTPSPTHLVAKKTTG
jgi:sulfoxide reductase heme-binding subunit YedZ